MYDSSSNPRSLLSLLSRPFHFLSCPLPSPSPLTRYAGRALLWHNALVLLCIAVLIPVSIRKVADFEKAVASSGLDALPSLPFYLSVEDGDVPKKGRNPDNLAARAGLERCAGHQDSMGAKLIQLGDPSKKLNPKEYFPSLNTIAGRKHLADAAAAAANLFPPNSAPDPRPS